MENDVITQDVNELTAALNITDPSEFDTGTIIKILCGKNLQERMEIRKQFLDQNQRTLENCLIECLTKMKIQKEFLILILALGMDSTEFYADRLHDAFAKSKYDNIVNIICTLTNSQMADLKDTYKSRYSHYQSTIENEIKRTLCEHMRQLIQKLCECKRNETDEVVAIDGDVKKLLLEKDPYDDEIISHFCIVFVVRSFRAIEEIRKTFDTEVGKENALETRIHKKFKMDDKLGYKAILHYSKNPEEYKIHLFTTGLKDKNSTHVALAILAFDNMEELKRCFEVYSGKTDLGSYIKKTTTGPYRQALLKLFNIDDPN